MTELPYILTVIPQGKHYQITLHWKNNNPAPQTVSGLELEQVGTAVTMTIEAARTFSHGEGA